MAPWDAAVGGAFIMTSCEGEERYKTDRAQTPADKQQQHIRKTAATERIIICLQSFTHRISAMSTHTSVLLLITLWASMEDGLALPVMKQLEVEAGDRVPTERVRTKRCACSSLLDSECHYFCHLDIIWVNTPSKTTVYGLGSALSRRRRSTGRCTCANTDDQTCTNFCHHSPEIPSPKRSVKRRQHNILSILRAAASRSKRAQDSPDSHRGEFSEGKNAR